MNFYFITKNIMETEYDILMAAISLQHWKSGKGGIWIWS